MTTKLQDFSKKHSFSWEHSIVVLTYTSTLTLPRQPTFGSHVFENAIKKIYFLILTDEILALLRILQYFINFIVTVSAIQAC